MLDFSAMSVTEINCYLAAATLNAAELAVLAADQRIGVRRLAQKYLHKQEAARLEKIRLRALQTFEEKARRAGFSYIAGVDEAGRGPLAGPVVAAAVILPADFFLPGLNDSKKLSPARREELAAAIQDQALAWAVGRGEVAEIDRYNILNATKMAMSRAIRSLAVRPDYLLLDALELRDMPCPQKGIIGGDTLSASIAAASIIAKVTRDRLMCELARLHPGYGFAEHKGYPTREHRAAIARIGVSAVHRRSFALLPAGADK